MYPQKQEAQFEMRLSRVDGGPSKYYELDSVFEP